MLNRFGLLREGARCYKRGVTVYRWVVLSGVLLFLALGMGCSSPQTRSKERSETFAVMSERDQKLVLDGQIKEGFNEDAVYIALGPPLRMTRGKIGGKEEIRWIYGTMKIDRSPGYRYQGIHTNSRNGVIPSFVYDPDFVSQVVEDFAVIFRNGKVVGWQEL